MKLLSRLVSFDIRYTKGSIYHLSSAHSFYLSSLLFTPRCRGIGVLFFLSMSLCLISCGSRNAAFESLATEPSSALIEESIPTPTVALRVSEPTTLPSPSEKEVSYPAGTVRGVIYSHTGYPIAGARVRLQATNNLTMTGNDGSFSFNKIDFSAPVTITAWVDGYYVGWQRIVTSTQPVSITLKPYYTTDNVDYNWFSHEGAEGSLSCSHCMPCYTEWQQDAHSQSALNPRFLTMYNGTDVAGNQSPITRYASTQDYGMLPLPPDPAQPYYGPGYKLDFPDSAGNCATCHTPAAASAPGMAYQVDPNRLTGIHQEGIFCEFCHKVGAVTLDPTSGLPYPNMPGVLSMQLFRPEEGQQLFFGNFDDVTRRVSYMPLYEQSAYCAACHYGVFWDTVIYNSYGEWLASPYSQPIIGSTCQDCHMPEVDYDYFVYPEKGGLIRKDQSIYSHFMPGALDPNLLQNALSMEVEAQREQQSIRVLVTLTNDRTGHHVPTDSPLRHLILLVDVRDQSGAPIPILEGEQLPDWAGVGDAEQGCYAGLPGKVYARVLAELWTEITPSGAYWNQTRVVSDNRLAAFASDTSQYLFSLNSTGKVQVHIQLWYRRAFKELMDQKGWNIPDILMKEIIFNVE